MSQRSKLLIGRKNKQRSLRQKLALWLGSKLGLPITKTTPVTPSYVFEPEPTIRRPLFDYVNLFEVATTSWPLRRSFAAIIQECTRNRWRKEAKFKWKCIECGKEYSFTPEGEEPKCSCGGKLKPPSEEQSKQFNKILDKPNRDYHFDDFVRSSLFYDLALDDWYWGIAYKRVPKTNNGKIIIRNGEVEYKKVPAEVYIEDARFIYPIADQWGHLGGYEYFCPNCYDKIKGDQPVVSIHPDTPPDQKEKLIICPYCGGRMESTAYVQEISGTVLARFTKDEIIHGSSSRVLPSLFGNSRIITVWTLVQTILSMDEYNYEVYSEGKVGSILGLPGYDQMEVDEIKGNIEEELKSLDRKDIQMGRYKTSKKIRTLMLGLKGDTPPIHIPVMEDLKKMQSIEFYKLYTDAIAGVYGVAPEFVSSSEGSLGTKFKIEVQNRTIVERQSNFADLFNSEVLPKFGITDWILVFNPVEARDELRLAQVHQTKAAAAFTYLRGGFNVSIGPDKNLLVSGAGKLREEEPEGSRAREDRAMGGKPWRWEYGEGSRTQGQQVELGAEGVGLPTSWYSMIQIRLWDRVFALNGDQNEVYLMINKAEVKDTRTSATNFSYAVASLINYMLMFVGEKLEGTPGFNISDFNDGRKDIVISMRREFKPSKLIDLANFMDSIGLLWLGQKIDNLRMRLESIKINSREYFGEPGTETGSGEMLEPIIQAIETDQDLQRKSEVKARAPFGVVYEEKTLAKQLTSILNWAKREIKRGQEKKKVFKDAQFKAKRTIEASYQKLNERALSHSKRRTKKSVKISPDELRRLEVYKENSLQDFIKILDDSFKSIKKSKSEKERVRLPTSWYNLTKLDIYGHTYAIIQDQNEIYLSKDQKEIEGTRMDARKFGDSFALLLEYIINLVLNKLKGKEGFDKDKFKKHTKILLSKFRRGLEDGIEELKVFNTYLDSISLKWLADKLDEWNSRIKQLKLSALESEPA